MSVPGDPGILISPGAAKRIGRGIRKVEGGDRSGAGFDGGRDRGGEGIDFVKLTSSTPDGSNVRWTYTGRVVKQSGVAWSGWAEITGDDVTAYNGIEAPNGSSGTFGNNVNSANIPDGFAMQPIGNGTIVLAQRITNSAGDSEYWFSAVNQVDGSGD